MSSLAWKINRIKAMDPAEILFRVGRVVQGKLERRRIDGGWQPHPRQPVSGRGSLFQGDPQTIIAQWQNAYGDRLGGYETLLSGEVDIFGHHKVSVLGDFNWHRDPESGIVAPLIYGKGIDYRDNDRVGNCKTLWEVARHPHLVPLAVAYAATGDARYADLAVGQIDSWIEQNPFGLGVHWCSTLEAALRLVAWAFVHSLLSLRDAKGLFGRAKDPAALGLAIYQHAHFIRHYLSRHSSANNHLIGELTGLWVGCNVFDLGDEGETWAAQAKQELEAEAVKQVFEDGVNREQANYYHLWVMEYLFLNRLVGERYGNPFSDTFCSRVVAMERFISALRPVGGTVPQIGDSDDGVVVRFEPQDPTDPYRDVCCAIRAVTGQGCSGAKLPQKAFWYALMAGSEDEGSAQAAEDHAAPGGLLFSDGGYAVLKGNGAHVIFDAGPLGYPSIAAHGHADANSLLLALNGRWWLVDPGTYCYHTQPDWRDYFRSTAAHNTVEINGHDQSQIGGAFLWLQHSRQHLEGLEMTASFSRMSVAGSVTGYADRSVRHQRRVTLVTEQRQLRVEDEIHADAVTAVRVFFHFHPDVTLQTGDAPHQFRARMQGVEEMLEIHGDPALQWRIHRGEEQPHLGWYSESLGSRQPIDVLVGTLKAEPGERFSCEFTW